MTDSLPTFIPPTGPTRWLTTGHYPYYGTHRRELHLETSVLGGFDNLADAGEAVREAVREADAAEHERGFLSTTRTMKIVVETTYIRPRTRQEEEGL